MKFTAIIKRANLSGHLAIDINVDETCAGTLFLTPRQWKKLQRICKGRIKEEKESDE